MRWILAAGCLFAGVAAMPALSAGGTAGAATANAAAANGRPLVYVVVIDGLDGDAVDAGNAPFISTMLAGTGDTRATYFRESRSVIPAMTNPNHTAMMTGAYPGGSGIFANLFAIYAPLANEDTCETTGPFNVGMLPHETSGESRTCPQAEMVFEAIRRQGNPDRLVTAFATGKPKLGRIFAGRNFNPRRRDVDHLWAPCASGPDDDEYCGAVPTNPISGYAIDDAAVMDEVIRTIEQGVPVRGKLRRPNFTFVNLHQVDSAGHAFGRGPIYDAAVAMADAEVQRLVETLEERGEWKRTVLIVLSDHSMDSAPTKISLQSAFEDAGIAAGDFLVVDSTNNGNVGLVYLANRRAADRHELLKRMRAAALATGGVDEALYRRPNPAHGGRAYTVAATHPGWHLAGARIGDLLVTSQPGFSFADRSASSNPLLGNHGSPYTSDNFLAVVGGFALVRQRSLAGRVAPRFDDTLLNPHQAENVDVAATVMGLFGMFAPADNRGRFLGQAFDRRLLRTFSRPYRPRFASASGRAAARPGVRRLSWTPRGGRYDLEILRGGAWRRRLDNSRRTAIALKAPPGSRLRVRLRSRAASGVPSYWRHKRVVFGS